MDFSLLALTIRLRAHLYDKLGRHQCVTLYLYLCQLICCFSGEFQWRIKVEVIFLPGLSHCPHQSLHPGKTHDPAQLTCSCIFPESQIQTSNCLIPSRLPSCGIEAGKPFPYSTPAWVSCRTWVLPGRCPEVSEQHSIGVLGCQEVRHGKPDKGKATSSS